MKVLHIQLFDKGAQDDSSISIARASELSSFSFLQKGSIGEFLNFFSKTVSDRTTPGQRQSIREQSYTFHVYCVPTGELSAVMVTDEEYPVRVAFGLLNKVTDEWLEDHSKDEYEVDVTRARQSASTGAKFQEISWPKLAEYLRKYQDPKQADQIMKVQQELDETKIILHKTIESVLERGQKLDSLVERSENLSAQSKMFYKSAKKTNSCCIVM